MRVLVIGSGGREHAIVSKLAQSEGVSSLYCAPGNAGIMRLATCVPIKATDVEGVLAFCQKEGIDYVVVTPDDPLMLGMVDALSKAGIACFGPNKEAALIEGSKAFAKAFMQRHNIPTAAYEVFDDLHAAMAYLRAQKRFPIVLKADGLALGKGVLIAQNLEEGTTALLHMMEGGAFGDAGRRVVIEEFLTGRELSLLAFCDGTNIVPLSSARDYKRAFDGDKGPNTGGMGTLSPVSYFSEALQQRCMEEILRPTIDGMRAEGRPFSGCLFVGLMLCEDGLKVIEYNARFGDPETQVVLARLESDLFELMRASSEGKLEGFTPKWSEQAAVCLVLASGGYPSGYKTGHPISGIEAAEGMEGVRVYHAGTKMVEGELCTSGGRVLGITAMGDSVEAARQKAYEAEKLINFTDKYCRSDIAAT